MISVACYKLGAFFARRLPPRVSESITEAILKGQYPFRRDSRSNVLSNLRLVMPNATEAERRHATRQVFSNFAKSIFYFLRLPFINRQELQSRCDYNGLDRLADELGRKGGFIIVGPHLGVWEVGGACLTAMGVKLATVALPHRSARVTRFFEQRRALLGIESVSMGEQSADSLQRALRNGRSVALLIDRPYGGRKRSLQMFDRPVDLPVGYAALAVRCRVPLVTSACVLDGHGGFRFVYNGPYYPQKDLGYQAAMKHLQELCVRDMECLITKHPEQWFNFERL